MIPDGRICPRRALPDEALRSSCWPRTTLDGPSGEGSASPGACVVGVPIGARCPCRSDLAVRVRQVSRVDQRVTTWWRPDVIGPIGASRSRARGHRADLTVTITGMRRALPRLHWFLAVCRVAPDDGTKVVGWLMGPCCSPSAVGRRTESGGSPDYLDEQTDLRPDSRRADRRAASWSRRPARSHVEPQPLMPTGRRAGQGRDPEPLNPCPARLCRWWARRTETINGAIWAWPDGSRPVCSWWIRSPEAGHPAAVIRGHRATPRSRPWAARNGRHAWLGGYERMAVNELASLARRRSNEHRRNTPTEPMRTWGTFRSPSPIAEMPPATPLPCLVSQAVASTGAIGVPACRGTCSRHGAGIQAA
jgi:hypothetical protein